MGSGKVLRSAAIALAAIAAITFFGCSTIEPKPYWAAKNTVNNACPTEEIDNGCAKDGTPELWKLKVGDQFKLHFVEFDDQGWLYAPEKTILAPGQPTQIDWILQDLHDTLAKTKKQIRIVVYVHGWKHNAEPQDPDVRKFRHFLAHLRGSQVASARAMNREVDSELVGIYVGWRGKSWEETTGVHDFMLNTTFWSRKAAAIRVAQGQPRELFARLRAFQQEANSINNNGCPRAKGELQQLQCRVRTAIVGHSFGGWIVHAALGESMIDVLAEEREGPYEAAAKNAKASYIAETNTRLADTILLINPAFEASRYEAIHQLAKSLAPANYRPPLLVMVTSDKDEATRKAFPLGRWINGVFEKKSTDRQKIAIRNTPGHIEPLHTHELIVDPTPAACAGWKPLYTFNEPKKELQLNYADAAELERQLKTNNQAELGVWKDFFGAKRPYTLQPDWSRQFCGGLRLTQLKKEGGQHPHTPVWNVRTTAPIIHNHNDFMTPEFMDFVRQIYLDSEFIR